MQIVRDLAGYTLGRSDLLRRAMSKKKASVMEKERQNFVYGNESEHVPGCIKNGISEATANKIYDEMIDFAKYAFNKSHAAAYAVVAYQTAYLKYYYPVEFMAALMTSVIDNSQKVSGYIYTCRQMKIPILAPDVNESEGAFSVSNGGIRYGMSAVKSVGKSVVQEIVAERKRGGVFCDLSDFIHRMNGKEVNKRTVENLIKAGAFDSLEGTRKQKIAVFASMIESVAQEKKKTIEGQMSLFDLVSEEEKQNYQIRFPDCGEYPKEVILGFEKEVLGFYISGHPLEEYEEKWKKNITAKTTDFILDDETQQAEVFDGQKVWIGGIITSKSVKTTKTNKRMAFLTLEDLTGTVEVLVFPVDYEKNRRYLEEEAKVFIQGRVTISEEAQGKLICERVVPFSNVPRELWIQFRDKEEYLQKNETLFSLIQDSDGKDTIVIYLAAEKAKKALPLNYSVEVNALLLSRLYPVFGEGNVKVIEKTIEDIDGKGAGSRRYR